MELHTPGLVATSLDYRRVYTVRTEIPIWWNYLIRIPADAGTEMGRQFWGSGGGTLKGSHAHSHRPMAHYEEYSVL